MPHIYAVGDCAGYWQLAHTAFREGEVAAENACGHEATIGDPAVPRPIYTDPEIAGVGLTEAQARELHGDDIAVGMFPWVANARAVMQAETVGWVKSIHETKYGELLGLIMVGPHVTDLIEAGTVALDAEATVETVADGMAAHPTLSEAIKEAGLVALGRAIHLPNKKRAATRRPSNKSFQSRARFPQGRHLLLPRTCPRPHIGAVPPAGPAFSPRIAPLPQRGRFAFRAMSQGQSLGHGPNGWRVAGAKRPFRVFGADLDPLSRIQILVAPE